MRGRAGGAQNGNLDEERQEEEDGSICKRRRFASRVCQRARRLSGSDNGPPHLGNNRRWRAGSEDIGDSESIIAPLQDRQERQLVVQEEERGEVRRRSKEEKEESQRGKRRRKEEEEGR